MSTFNFFCILIFLNTFILIVGTQINAPNTNDTNKDVTQIRRCGSIYLSVNAHSRKLVMNWYYHKCNRLPDVLVLHKTTNSSIKDETLDTIEITRKYGSYETDVIWNSYDFPGKWSIKNPNPEQKSHICSMYYIASYRNRVQEDSQCLRISPNWMTRFPHLRLHKIFIPGTFYSGAIGKHQHYDFWGQLVFGIRYFDIRIGMGSKPKFNTSSYHTTKAESLPEELEKIQIFLKRTKKEIIILDFREFIRFRSDSHHDTLVKCLKQYFKNTMAPASLSSISTQKGGPTLKHLLDLNYRIIINYRHPKTVKRYDFLWNGILKKVCRSDYSTEVKKCLSEFDKNHNHRELSCSITPAIKSANQTDVKINTINGNLSRWLELEDLRQHINIISVDYFESTNIIVDALKVNMEKGKLQE